jgi:uncharacterized membrane protein
MADEVPGRRQDNMEAELHGSALFEARILPHRSLSARGVRYLSLGFLAAGVVLGIRFWLWNAWPVILFSSVDVLAMIVLLYLNVRASRECELILLHDDRLRVIRTDVRGTKQEVSLPTSWLNVVLEERTGRVPHLSVGHRGRREEIGGALGEAAKRSLAQALDAALHAARNPRFDNPQLREDPDQGQAASAGPIDLMSSNTRLRTDGSVMR